MYSRGFTLIELLVVGSLLALSLTIALPGLRGFLQSAQARAEADRLLSSLQLARSQAIANNLRTGICPVAPGPDPFSGCGSRYDRGWFVYLDRDGDGAFDATVDTALRRFDAMPHGFGLYNRAGSRRIDERVSFYPDGSSRRSMTLQVCPPAGGQVQPWSLVLNHVGRPRLSRDWGSCVL